MSTYYVAGIPYSDELYHFGIKGQKWGVRRYQNPDGTLTPEGKARYGEGDEGIKKLYEERKQQRIDTAKKVGKAAVKVAKIGAAVAVPMLMTYGTAKLGSAIVAQSGFLGRLWYQERAHFAGVDNSEFLTNLLVGLQNLSPAVANAVFPKIKSGNY